MRRTRTLSALVGALGVIFSLLVVGAAANATPRPHATYPGNIYNMVKSNPNLCVDADANYYGQLGDDVLQWDCNDHGEQTFTQTGQYCYDGLCNYELATSNGQCLSIVGNTNYNGNALDMWTCNGRETERWWHTTWGTGSNPSFVWVNMASSSPNGVDYCIDADSNDFQQGGVMQEWSCNTNATQSWSAP
jgi:hypothetical protein